MGHSFPSPFPPQEMWRAFYPWEQNRVILGQVPVKYLISKYICGASELQRCIV